MLGKSFASKVYLAIFMNVVDLGFNYNILSPIISSFLNRLTFHISINYTIYAIGR